MACCSCGRESQSLNVVYQQGDFWVAHFRNNSFPSKAFADDKIYCSGLSVDTQNYFYCLNLKTGKVDWAIPVASWAAQEPVIGNDFIYYCGYLGDIYKFDKQGNQIWYTKLAGSYGGHDMEPFSKDLLVDVVASGYRRFSFETGEQTAGIGNTGAPLPVIAGDTVYQLVHDSLFCTLASTHADIWKIRCPDVRKIFPGTGSLYYFDKTLHLNARDAQTGALQWTSDTAFPTGEVNPHVALEQGSLLCYFSNLNDARVFNIKTGQQEDTLTYEELGQRYLKPIRQYLVSGEERRYEITINNSFGGEGSFRDAFDVVVVDKADQ
jgi:hypothetical protein